jgi:predicted nucleotidyltransferase
MNSDEIYRRIPSIASPLKRQLMTVALISRMLQERGSRPPVIIGGCALAYYSREVYFSNDIDLACSNRQALDGVLKALQFRTDGRYWINDFLDIAVEAPASALPGEDAPWEEIVLEEGLSCWVIGMEDLIVDRLNAAKHWKSRVDSEMVELLMARYGPGLDWDYLEKRCTAPENDTVQELKAIRGRIRNEKG